MKTEPLSEEQYQKMLAKLNAMYDREEQIKLEFEQLQEDKEMLQTMIMYKYNREHKIKKTSLSDILGKQKKNFK